MFYFSIYIFVYLVNVFEHEPFLKVAAYPLSIVFHYCMHRTNIHFTKTYYHPKIRKSHATPFVNDK